MLKRDQCEKTSYSHALLAMVMSGAVLAQQTRPELPVAPSSATSGPQSPQWRSLSVEEKLRYDARHLFEVDNLLDKLDHAVLSVVFATVQLDASQSSVATELAACSNATPREYLINRACGR